jgi:hypothetical protein
MHKALAQLQCIFTVHILQSLDAVLLEALWCVLGRLRPAVATLLFVQDTVKGMQLSLMRQESVFSMRSLQSINARKQRFAYDNKHAAEQTHRYTCASSAMVAVQRVGFSMNMDTVLHIGMHCFMCARCCAQCCACMYATTTPDRHFCLCVRVSTTMRQYWLVCVCPTTTAVQHSCVVSSQILLARFDVTHCTHALSPHHVCLFVILVALFTQSHHHQTAGVCAC